VILGGETEVGQAHEGGGQAELEQSPYRHEVLPLRVPIMYRARRKIIARIIDNHLKWPFK